VLRKRFPNISNVLYTNEERGRRQGRERVDVLCYVHSLGTLDSVWQGRANRFVTGKREMETV